MNNEEAVIIRRNHYGAFSEQLKVMFKKTLLKKQWGGFLDGRQLTASCDNISLGLIGCQNWRQNCFRQPKIAYAA